MNCGAWEGGNWIGAQPASRWCAEGATLLSSCRITHSIIYQLPTRAHCATSSVDLNCIGIASLIEQKWFSATPGEYIDPWGETRNKTMFLQEEYLTRGPITTSSIYSSKWVRRSKNEEQKRKKKSRIRGNVMAYSANGSLSSQVLNIQQSHLIWAV